MALRMARGSRASPELTATNSIPRKLKSAKGTASSTPRAPWGKKPPPVVNWGCTRPVVSSAVPMMTKTIIVITFSAASQYSTVPRRETSARFMSSSAAVMITIQNAAGTFGAQKRM